MLLAVREVMLTVLQQNCSLFVSSTRNDTNLRRNRRSPSALISHPLLSQHHGAQRLSPLGHSQHPPMVGEQETNPTDQLQLSRQS